MIRARPVIGILGVGELASFILQGAEGEGYSFLLSPRNAELAANLCQRFGAKVAHSNQDLVDRADMVLVCLPARTGTQILAELQFRPGQSVLSAMAGTSQAALQRAVAPAAAYCTMMPGFANTLKMGPCLLYPDNAPWHEFLSCLGPVHVFDQPEQFEAATAFGAFSGASVGFMSVVIDWFTAQGIDPKTARHLVAETLAGNAAVLRQVDATLPQIMSGVITPGGISELCLDTLNQGQALSRWNDALNAVLARIRE